MDHLGDYSEGEKKRKIALQLGHLSLADPSMESSWGFASFLAVETSTWFFTGQERDRRDSLMLTTDIIVCRHMRKIQAPTLYACYSWIELFFAV